MWTMNGLKPWSAYVDKIMGCGGEATGDRLRSLLGSQAQANHWRAGLRCEAWLSACGVRPVWEEPGVITEVVRLRSIEPYEDLVSDERALQTVMARETALYLRDRALMEGLSLRTVVARLEWIPLRRYRTLWHTWLSSDEPLRDDFSGADLINFIGQQDAGHIHPAVHWSSDNLSRYDLPDASVDRAIFAMIAIRLEMWDLLQICLKAYPSSLSEAFCGLEQYRTGALKSRRSASKVINFQSVLGKRDGR